MINGKEWSAEWIWGGEEESPRNEWRCFRRSFALPEGSSGPAKLSISADSRYVLYVNGAQVGRGPVRSWPAEQFYDTYEVGHLLKPGETNTIAVLVIHFGVSNFYYIRGRGGLLAELLLESPEGVSVAAGTDAAWKTAKLAAQHPEAPRMSCQQGFAEVYDARQWDDGWAKPEYDDRGWGNADSVGQVGEGPWKSLIARDIPFLTEEKTVPERIESLRRVKAPAWTAAIDLRAAMVPDSVNHANHVQYAGYLAALLVVSEPGTVTVGFPGGPRTPNVWIDGKQLENGYGVRPERYYEVELERGEHLLLIDVSSTDHGAAYHVAADGTAKFELRSPLAANGGESADTPFLIVGPFDSAVNIDHQGIVPINREQPDFVRAKGIAAAGDLRQFAAWIRPLPAALYTEDDVFGAGVWQIEAEAYAVPRAFENAIIPSPEPAVLPQFAQGDCELVIDFGKERSGFIGFEVEAEAGTVIDLYGIEYLKGDYRQHTYGLDNTTRYICRGGRQSFLSPVRRGFRYLLFTVRNSDKPVKLYEVYVNQSNYPVTDAGKFECSDPLLGQIWEISRHTTRLCMEDTFVDCPAYEQVFWVGDARNEALVNYYVFGALDIVKRCLKLVPGSREMTPLYVDQVPSGWNSVIPNWTFFWVNACAEYVEHTGDTAFAAEIWPAARYTLEHYLQKIDERGLLYIKGWNLLDWAPIDQPRDGVVTHQNMFLTLALRNAVKLARTAGADAAAADSFLAAADALQAAINTHLWNAEKGAYLDCIHVDGRQSSIFSMQTQVVAVLCGAAQGERKAKLEGYLLHPPEGFVRIGSPFMSFFYYEALVQSGQHAHMLEDIRVNFGQMIEHGATTCWEMYPNFAQNRANPDQLTRSHCHAWSAAPGYFLGESILGVKRKSPGWSRAAIEPNPCGLKWARGAVPLPDGGLIEVDWRIDGSRMLLRVSAPESVELDIRIPEGLEGEVVRSTTIPLR
ncbi:alpha-L-rhamnosidase [Paenibacillus hemerocallicola]|uniref:Alpha-L-rhamnosidase n=1 Tax=Paenibacillus hemerocallicola TaxID=1172614 RepID=A0A5C4T6D4_9BACL|nr:family 78 glycoside hydrolase catalytic domain [Paenibacillus hemerocallicola]TNJ63887.1 alpha-L-rhamnosidase [Paenibacillus hemerocallicola]